jgi:alpha-L-fucosidase 2
MMNRLNIFTALLFGTAALPLNAAPGPMELFTDKAAIYSTDTSLDAYPIGNGKLAAMIYGGVTQEIIQFNEDTVWAGTVHDYSHNNASNFLTQMRNYVWANQGENAYNLVAKDNFMSVPLRQSPYVATANLKINFTSGTTSPTNYKRSLDLSTALTKVEYASGGTTYTREYFASFPDKVIVTRLTASQPGSLHFNYTFDSQHTANTISVSGTDLVIDGKVNNDTLDNRRQQTSDVQFRAKVKIVAEGGTVTPGSTNITVAGANSVTLIMSVASNVAKYNALTRDRVAETDGIINAASAKTYDDLKAAHVADYQALFNRVELDLNSTNQSALTTSARLQRIRTAADAIKPPSGTGNDNYAPLQNAGADALKQDLQFVALNFQMARYIYISGSRPGSQPLNLQGKWCNELNPAWESKMTLNINQEMNYWGAEIMNLAECALPMVELSRDLSESGAIVAQKHYNAGGWVVHHNTDLWRGAAPINGADGIWPTGGAFLSQHLWWHYLYSGDTTYLGSIYPVMKGAAQFFLDTLVEDKRPGRQSYFMTNPSHSPEQQNPALNPNGSMVAGVTMDNQLIRELFTYVIEASEVLGIDADFRTTLETKRGLLPPNRIGKHGQLQEWLEDVDVSNQHRHLSPLFALFPADQISPIYDPALAAGVKVHLDWKTDTTNNTSWSQAWKMCLRNALFDGNKGFVTLTNLFRTSHSDNLLFSTKGSEENQIDGNLGSGMGIAMFFLQNNRGEIQLLPALPTYIPQGSVKGLRSPGAFTVGITWAAGQLTKATIHSDLGNACRIRVHTPIAVRKEDGHEVPVTNVSENLYEFPTTAGADYAIYPSDSAPPTPTPTPTINRPPAPANPSTAVIDRKIKKVKNQIKAAKKMDDADARAKKLQKLKAKLKKLKKAKGSL